MPVSIHAPRAGRDNGIWEPHCLKMFQSTRPARGATLFGVASMGVFVFQSTRPARGATLTAKAIKAAKKFQSTRPARGATLCPGTVGRDGSVSIHAPRAGRDLWAPARMDSLECFNPRAPRGARRQQIQQNWTVFGFNPRAPRGARRAIRVLAGQLGVVSIHAPRAGRDSTASPTDLPIRSFNPRAPRGARPPDLR